MPIVKTDKKEILKAALSIFRVKGYYATSMADLSEACGLQKGSFYHYFKNKEAIMLELLELTDEKLITRVFSIAYEESLSPVARLETLLLNLGKTLLIQNGGCLVGNTILETSSNVGQFNSILKSIFDNWTLALTHIYKSLYPTETAKRMAEQTIMEFEGAIMFTQLYKEDRFLKEVYLKTLALLNPSKN